MDRASEQDDSDGKTAVQEDSAWTKYLRGLLLVSVTPGLPLTMATLGLSLLLLTWATLPSIVFEIKPEWTKNAAANRIRWAGEWLSRGLDNTAILTRVLWFGIVPIPLFFFAIDWLALRDYLHEPWLNDLYKASKFTLPLIKGAGLGIALSGAAVFGFALKYLTTVLDTILDIDNYLRISPLDQTPRAFRSAAYRYCATSPPIATIEAAHIRRSSSWPTASVRWSLPTCSAIWSAPQSTARIRAWPDTDSAKNPSPGRIEASDLRLLDGQPSSPIAQSLFSAFVLVGFRRPRQLFLPSQLSAPLPPPIPDIPVPSLPRTDEMNVALWTNAYRSGDYIGRSLWIGQWLNRNGTGDAKQPPDVAYAAAPQSCAETCIGLGAHTHYWDRSAPEVAAALDRLIAMR